MGINFYHQAFFKFNLCFLKHQEGKEGNTTYVYFTFIPNPPKWVSAESRTQPRLVFVILLLEVTDLMFALDSVSAKIAAAPGQQKHNRFGREGWGTPPPGFQQNIP